jgi:hypothetical protein
MNKVRIISTEGASVNLVKCSGYVRMGLRLCIRCNTEAGRGSRCKINTATCAQGTVEKLLETMFPVAPESELLASGHPARMCVRKQRNIHCSEPLPNNYQ